MTLWMPARTCELKTVPSCCAEQISRPEEQAWSSHVFCMEHVVPLLNLPNNRIKDIVAGITPCTNNHIMALLKGDMACQVVLVLGAEG